MKQRPISYATLTFGITEYKGVSKKADKYKKTVDVSVVGESLSDVLVFNPGIEDKYRGILNVKEKSEIKLINFKLIHSQGLTTYKI